MRQPLRNELRNSIESPPSRRSPNQHRPSPESLHQHRIRRLSSSELSDLQAPESRRRNPQEHEVPSLAPDSRKRSHRPVSSIPRDGIQSLRSRVVQSDAQDPGYYPPRRSVDSNRPSSRHGLLGRGVRKTVVRRSSRGDRRVHHPHDSAGRRGR
jgi:hypothetical protein